MANEADDDEHQADAGRSPEDRSDRPLEIDPSQIPPATMTTFISMLSTQAMVALGLLAHPQTGRNERQLPLARHFIDLLAVLETKTRGNLTSDEAKLLEMSLHELRMAFVQMSRS